MSNRLKEIRSEEKDLPVEQKLLRSDWMELSEIMPAIDISTKYDFNIDKSFNWNKWLEEYTPQEINQMGDWVKNQKKIDNDHSIENSSPIVLPEQLNKKQWLAYNIVKSFNEKQEQLLMIIIGTAGTGKTFTVNALTHLLKKKTL